MDLNLVVGKVGESMNNSLDSSLSNYNWTSALEDDSGILEQGPILPRIYLNGSTLPSFMGNDSEEFEDEYIFDRLYVRVIFIFLYTIVFCFCFLGNLMVILVVTLHWRMRNITKFCLANLAFADLCVGVFCVYQNLSIYLIQSWVLGEVLCKMYHFINGLSHTSSVLILVVICVERYLAILHPFKCKRILTKGRLRVLIIGVWFISAVYCSPRLYYVVTTPIPRLDGGTEIICTANRLLYDSGLFDMIHFFLLFLLPLLVITILYTCVGITLWKSSLSPNAAPLPAKPSLAKPSFFRRRRRKSVKIPDNPVQSNPDDVIKYGKSSNSGGGSTVSTPSPSGTNFTSIPGLGGGGGESKKRGGGSFRRNSELRRSPSYRITVEDKCYIVGDGVETQVVDMRGGPLPQLVVTGCEEVAGGGVNGSHSLKGVLKPSLAAPVKGKDSGSPCPLNRQLTRCGSRFNNNATGASRRGRDPLKSRQTVVRMMIVIVVSFGVCNFPVHLRKLILYWSPNFDYTSHFSTLATPVTHLIMYVNCAINPMIYAFMSKTFRSSFLDLLCCRLKRKHDPRKGNGLHRGSVAQASHVSKQDDGDDTD